MLHAAPSAAPEQILVSIVSSTAVKIEWDPPRLEDRNGIIREYIINITELNTGNSWQLAVGNGTVTGDFWQQTVGNNTVTTFIDSLHPFYLYSFSIAAQTIALGPFTASVIVEMPEDGKYF